MVSSCLTFQFDYRSEVPCAIKTGLCLHLGAYMAVIKIMTQSNLVKKRVYLASCLKHSPLLGEVRAGTQAGLGSRN